MSDSNTTGTVESDVSSNSQGTQDVDAATNTGTAQAVGTQDTATQPEQAVSQSATVTTNPTTTGTSASAGKPAVAQAKAETPNANPWESDENPYRKRFNDTLSHSQRLYQENQQRSRQLQELEARIADFDKKAQAQAEAAKLNPWNKGHPKFDSHRALSSRAEAYADLMRSAETPEEKAALHKVMSGKFTPDEMAQLQQSEADRKQTLAEFTSDPRGFIVSNVQDAIRQELARYEEFQGARQQVQGIITDPTNAKLIEAYAPDMHRMMDPNVSAHEKAFAFATVKAELDALKAQVGKQAEQVATAEARQTARTGRSATSSTRQPEQRNAIDIRRDVDERLKKAGITVGDQRYLTELAREMARAS